MDIITLNVGQGELVIVRNQGEALVIDARIPNSKDKYLAYVKGYLSRFLKGYYLRGLILTGFDKDHVDARAVAVVLRKYQPNWVIYPDYDKDTLEFLKVQEIIESETEKRKNTISPLLNLPISLGMVSSSRIQELAEQFDFEFFSPHPEDMDTSNNCSLVVKISGLGNKGFSYLVTGDTENKRWKKINRIFKSRLQSDVMSAPHHGSRNATNAATLCLVNPNTILISAGVNNSYGHPHEEVLEAYTQVAEHVFATCVDDGCSLFTRRNGDDFQTIAFTN